MTYAVITTGVQSNFTKAHIVTEHGSFDSIRQAVLI